MRRTAYEPLPRRDQQVTLAYPELGFGHPLPSLAAARIFLVLAIFCAFGLGLALVTPSESVEDGVASSVIWLRILMGSLLVIYASISIFKYRKALPLRRTEQEKQNRTRTSYIGDRLLPFLKNAYGVTQIASLPALLQGLPTDAIRDGERISVVILEGKNNSIELGDGSTGRRIEDDDSSAAGGSETAALLVLFPYSIEHMVLTGDGSLHSTVDGGSFDASSGDGDGGGDGD